MAELGLYMTEGDELPIISLALEMGCKVIPDTGYTTPRYESLTNLKDYKRYRTRERGFYFISDRFFRCPIEMRRILKNDKVVYYIGNDGGPRLQLTGGGLFEDGDCEFIRPGGIGHQARYWNTSDQTMEKPPSELVETYKALQKLIRASFRHAKPGKVSFWVGPETVQAVRKGAKLVGYEKYSAQQLLE
jgi:hypothetical protein